MRETEPQVWLIARPALDWEMLRKYLVDVDGAEWWDRAAERADTVDGETLVEVGGRLCYRSWKPGLNANVTKVREDPAAYFGNLLASGHGSVLEHANYSFIFSDVSRVFTHELVRHRAGVAISQESLRFVRLTDLGVRIPDILTSKPLHGDFVRRDGTHTDEYDPVTPRVVQLVETMEEFQRDMAEHFGLDDDGVPFHYKKTVTSALRRLAPIGLSTSMLWTANVRTLRHVIAMRTHESAEEEIRIVFDQVARLMKAECPLLFQDVDEIDEDDDGNPLEPPAWRTRHWKV